MTGPPGPVRTLLDELRQRFPEASTSTLRQMLAHDRVQVNGVAERVAKRPLDEHDRVEVLPRHARPIDPRLRILFEDGDLVVVEKAAGLLSVPSSEDTGEETAEGLLDARAGGTPHRPRVQHVHRLDRDTSGVLVFAKGELVRDRLRDLFGAHDVERVYVAIVQGRMQRPAGTLRSFLAEGTDLRVRRVADPRQGKEAITRYRTIATGARYSMLALTLETGRRHQIRVQLADAGHPVAGDRVYGRGPEDPLGRLALHAERLGFVHPRTHERLSFVAEVPDSFRSLEL